jgi:hypothetical protein
VPILLFIFNKIFIVKCWKIKEGYMKAEMNNLIRYKLVESFSEDGAVLTQRTCFIKQKDSPFNKESLEAEVDPPDHNTLVFCVVHKQCLGGVGRFGHIMDLERNIVKWFIISRINHRYEAYELQLGDLFWIVGLPTPIGAVVGEKPEEMISWERVEELDLMGLGRKYQEMVFASERKIRRGNN